MQAGVDARWMNTTIKYASSVIPGVIQTSVEFRVSDESKPPEAEANAAAAAREADPALMVAQAQAEVKAHAAVAAVQAVFRRPILVPGTCRYSDLYIYIYIYIVQQQ